MNSKKIPLILIAVAFLIAALCSCYFLFTIAEVEADFAVSDRVDVKEICDDLDSLRGKSVVFFEKKEVQEIMEKYPTLKLQEARVKSPNTLVLKIMERIPVYKLLIGGQVYLLDEEGVAVSFGQGDYKDRELITLNVEGISLAEEIVLGKKAATSKDDVFYNALAMAKQVDLTDIIKEITVNYLSAGENRDVVFSTYTGVNITVTKADEYGLEKVQKAFDAYHENTNDYLKYMNRILVVMLDSGEISVTWTRS